jgi:hypothetical protein
LYGNAFSIAKARPERATTYARSSSPAARASQKTQPSSDVPSFADSMYAIRHGAQSRST